MSHIEKRLTPTRRLDRHGVLSIKEDQEVTMDDASASLEDAVETFDESSADMSVIVDLIQRDYQSRFGPSEANNSPAEFLKVFRDLDYTLRADEESYMREPLPGERLCARGIHCEGRKIFTGGMRPVTLVEHLTARQRQEPPEAAQMCILCKRSVVTYYYVQNVCEGTDSSRLFHSHCNFPDSQGEYALSQMLLSGRSETHGVLAPCVAHCRVYLEASMTPQGIVKFTQPGYKKDF